MSIYATHKSEKIKTKKKKHFSFANREGQTEKHCKLEAHQKAKRLTKEMIKARFSGFFPSFSRTAEEKLERDGGDGVRGRRVNLRTTKYFLNGGVAAAHSFVVIQCMRPEQPYRNHYEDARTKVADEIMLSRELSHPYASHGR